MSDLVARLNAALEGRYLVEREIGEGGMATVCLAEDSRHERKVALKVLKPDLAAAVGADRFLAEIKTTANLRHLHILPLHDSGEADGFLFYVMPFVEGASLRERLARDGRLPVPEAVRIATDVASALDHAHRHGVIHRDVKPANVLLIDGEAVLADFGIALGIDSHAGPRMTETGSSIGTPGYMSPEQAAGDRELSPRSDIYSLGALLFEMLAGEPPFASGSPLGALARVLTEDPPDVRSMNPAVPESLSRQIMHALARDPGGRPESAAAWADAVRAAGSADRRDASRPSRPRWMAVGFAAAAIVLGGLWFQSSREARWARAVAIPEIQRLLGVGEQVEAFALASRAVSVLRDDPTLAALYDAAGAEVAITSSPPGALVSYRPYDPDDTAWVEVGPTPLDELPLPDDELLIRFELPGHHPYTQAYSPAWGSLHADLSPDTSPEEVLQAAGFYSMTGEGVALDTFWIDVHEVTNSEYQAFVEAADYASPLYWSDPFTAYGVAPDLDRMVTEFVDQTGRPGPAGWELSRPPQGEDRYPVQGVSWYEAVAYCAFRGRSLPTYYHWKYADAGEVSAWDGSLQHGNIGGRSGPTAVEASEAYSVRGVSDMVGNVREWVWNASRQERYALGGSWLSPPHIYTAFDAADPWSRDPENGFRCARYQGEVEAALFEPIQSPIFDFNGYQPVDDATFAGFASLFRYDDAALAVTRTVVSETADWTKEYVEFNAAYLDERVAVHLFLPKNTSRPYQSVVYFPGASAFRLSSSENLAEMSRLMFVPQSGRALLYPVIIGTYERQFDRRSRGMTEQAQRSVWMTQDILRTVDFVQSQSDLDSEGIAYLGVSYGAELAVPVAIEKRFRAAVLIGGALDPAWWGVVPEETAPWNFVSRITTPTLLVNGRYDFMHPYDESQVPFFRMIDVPDADKRFVVLDAGHLPPTNEVIGLTLSWLDERLGPVARGPGGR